MPFFDFSGSIFWDAVTSNKLMAKNRTKPKIHRIGISRWLKMKPDEIIEKLKKLDIEISRQTLLNYEKWELIPLPKRGGAGKGKGRWTEYPEHALPEFIASWSMLHGNYRLKPGFVAQLRKKSLEFADRPVTIKLQEPGFNDLILSLSWLTIKNLFAGFDYTRVNKEEALGWLKEPPISISGDAGGCIIFYGHLDDEDENE